MAEFPEWHFSLCWQIAISKKTTAVAKHYGIRVAVPSSVFDLAYGIGSFQVLARL